MKTIYLDSDFRCHVAYNSNMIAIETEYFDGKCDTFIEGYRFVPAGMSWTNENDIVYFGELATPFKDSMLLETMQSLYEETLVDKARITALEKENSMLTECVLEMSEIIYA